MGLRAINLYLFFGLVGAKSNSINFLHGANDSILHNRCGQLNKAPLGTLLISDAG